MNSVSKGLQDLAAGLRGRSSEIVAATGVRLHQELPDIFKVNSPDFQEAGYGAVCDVLGCVWTTLENGGTPPEHLPAHLVDEAHTAAQNNVSWEIVDRSYGITHEVVWDAIVVDLARLQAGGKDHTLMLQIASRCLFRCFDFLTTAAGRLYEQERTAAIDRRQKRLGELVEHVLNGFRVTDSELGYSTELEHVAVIGWGPQASVAVHHGARVLGAELLVVPRSGSSLWAWLGARRFKVDYREIVSAFHPPPATYFAIGAVEKGRSGFVTSHHQAVLASYVSVRRLVRQDQGVVAYPDVAVETLALADEFRARTFANYVLHPLAGSDASSARLRETLRVYAQCKENAARTAAELGIAERTVRYRLRTAADRLGTRVSPQDVALAIRVFAALEAQASKRSSNVIGYAQPPMLPPPPVDGHQVANRLPEIADGLGGLVA